MGESIKFTKVAKRRKKDLESFGADSSEPLSAEYIRDLYNGQFEAAEGLRAVADSVEDASVRYTREKDIKLAHKDAKRYRKQGRVMVDRTVKSAAKYIDKHNGHYYEQAKAEDTPSRSELKEREEGFDSTLREIEDLPEHLNGPNN